MDMTPAELDAAAKQLYDINANRVKPAWENLGDAIKSVWRGYVLNEDVRVSRLAEYYQGNQ